MSEERVPRDERIQTASDNERSNRARLLFQIVLGFFIAVLLLLFVIQPAVARGGLGEILIVAGIFIAILLVERFLRTR